MTSQRLDIHRPSDTYFDPEAYEVVGIFDTHRTHGNSVQHREALTRLHDEGMTLGAGSARQCGHCGTRIRYSALLLRRDIREYIYVGETCLDNRFTNMTAAQFQALRTQARLNAERARRADRRNALIEEHPELAWLTYPDVIRLFASTYLRNMSYRLKKYGELTDRQIAATKRALVADSERYYAQIEREAQWAAERAAASPVLSGRTVVLGEVISVKWVAGYGYNSPSVKKIQIKTQAGWRVYMTCPQAISEVKKGDQVAVTVTITPSDDDPTFGFGKRPARAEIVSSA